LTFSEGDFKDQGSYSIEKLTKIRALGAKNLHNSWVSIPHVTHFEDVNLKALNDIRVETKYSLLAYFVYALSQTLKEFPYFNASLISKDEVLLKDYINIGIAVDTEMGLVVPVLKDADKKNVQQISEEINFLAEKARERKVFEKDLAGSTFTISSLGKIGGTGFTPIINPPEVAIVSLSRSKKILQLVDNIPVEIEILPFGLSYDHRVINGADAGRFCYHLKSLIESIS
jgi:pyruvate dehydrogenase E2 component (dihydrolipoamide acetyltransferase)